MTTTVWMIPKSYPPLANVSPNLMSSCLPRNYNKTALLAMKTLPMASLTMFQSTSFTAVSWPATRRVQPPPPHFTTRTISTLTTIQKIQATSLLSAQTKSPRITPPVMKKTETVSVLQLQLTPLLHQSHGNLSSMIKMLQQCSPRPCDPRFLPGLGQPSRS
jgi:hypothetical protein